MSRAEMVRIQDEAIKASQRDLRRLKEKETDEQYEQKMLKLWEGMFLPDLHDSSFRAVFG